MTNDCIKLYSWAYMFFHIAELNAVHLVKLVFCMYVCIKGLESNFSR